MLCKSYTIIRESVPKYIFHCETVSGDTVDISIPVSKITKLREMYYATNAPIGGIYAEYLYYTSVMKVLPQTWSSNYKTYKPWLTKENRHVIIICDFYYEFSRALDKYIGNRVKLNNKLAAHLATMELSPLSPQYMAASILGGSVAEQASEEIDTCISNKSLALFDSLKGTEDMNREDIDNYLKLIL